MANLWFFLGSHSSFQFLYWIAVREAPLHMYILRIIPNVLFYGSLQDDLYSGEGARLGVCFKLSSTLLLYRFKDLFLETTGAMQDITLQKWVLTIYRFSNNVSSLKSILFLVSNIFLCDVIKNEKLHLLSSFRPQLLHIIRSSFFECVIWVSDLEGQNECTVPTFL